MTPEHLDHVQDTATIEALRATRGTGQWTGLSTPELIRRGNRSRRRRYVQQAGGGLTGVAAVVALAMFVGGGAHSSEVVPAGGGTPSPAPTGSGSSSTEVLLQQLGPDFRTATNPSHGPIEVVPGSRAVEELPKGYGASADIQILPTRPAGVSAADDPSDLPPLGELCAPSQEKGLIMEACTPDQLPDGRTVQVQHGSLTAGNYKTYGGRSTPGSGNTVTVYYQRQDDSVVRVQLTAYDTPAASTAARQRKAAEWLPQWMPALENTAADPRIGPPPGPTTAHPPTNAQQQRTQLELSALQQNLGTAFDLGDGTVYLEPGSALEGQLPDRRYMAHASVSHLDAADLKKACGTDLSDCVPIALPGGAKAYAITTSQPWKSFAINAPTPDPGASGIDLVITAYEPQPGGQVIATAVELAGNVAFTAAEQADQTPKDKAWLKALQTRLAQADDEIGRLDTKEATSTPGPQN